MVKTWCESNRMILNASKTKLINFSQRLYLTLQFHKFDCGEEVVCDGKVKDQVERTKYLRFIMDQKPGWKQHISSLQVRLRKN